MKANEFLVFDESFDSNVPIKWVKDDNDSTIGEFVINDNKYYLESQYATYDTGNGIVPFANIFFYTVNEHGILDANLTGLNKGAATVFATVLSGVRHIVNSNSLIAIIFGATDNTEKRMKLYNLIASKMFKDFGSFMRDVKTTSGNITICFNKNAFADSDSYLNFIEYVKTKIQTK